MGLESGIFMCVELFDLSKIFDLSKNVALPNNSLKSKNYCIRLYIVEGRT